MGKKAKVAQTEFPVSHFVPWANFQLKESKHWGSKSAEEKGKKKKKRKERVKSLST